jgi:8-oxo-dGTP pyrophosphatase MutT (NUDIX family)
MRHAETTMIQLHVFRERAGGTEYLLLRRSENETIYPGIWQMVTGMIEREETPASAAMREMEEETGLSASELIVIPYIASFYMHQNHTVQLVPVFAARADERSEIVLSDEHEEYAWLPFGEAMDRLVFPGHRQGLEILRSYVLSGISPQVIVPRHEL